LRNGGPSAAYNLGNGHGFSVREVIACAQAITGREILVVLGPRRPGDPPRLARIAHKGVAAGRECDQKMAGWAEMLANPSIGCRLE